MKLFILLKIQILKSSNLMKTFEPFEYGKAFSRNLGWVTSEEQSKLKNTKIAIAGMGGVGGVHLLTLARLGIGKFHIADFDTFEIQNFNRQVGADLSTIGQAKIDVMNTRAHLINPELEIRSFDSGITAENISDFLEGVDIYVDGLDVFVLTLRQSLFEECRKRQIPVLTVAPIGSGAACLVFTENSMSADQYFGWKNKSEIELYARFILGFSPHFLHLPSLVDRRYANAHQKKAPSLPMGCELAAGIMGSEVLKLALKRGRRIQAPFSYQLDIYSLRWKKAWIPWGAKNIFFKIKLKIFLWLLERARQQTETITSHSLQSGTK